MRGDRDRQTTRRRAPSGPIALWNPELIDAELGVRASALGDASRLLAGFVARGPADDLLREEPQGGRADPPLRLRPRRARLAARLAPYRAGYTPQQRREIERRLVEGELLGVTRDGRARARDRHRPARLRDLGRLPRHGRVAAAAVGSRGPPRPRPRGARRERGRARPVLHARARDAARPNASRRRSSTMRTRACSTGTCASAAFEAPIDDADARDARRRGARARAAAAGAEATRRAAGSGPARTTRPRASPLRSGEPDSFTVVDAETGAVLGTRRARARVLDRPRRRRLPPPRRAVPRRELDLDGAARARRASTGDWYTQAKKETDDRDRRAAARRAPARARARRSAASR